MNNTLISWLIALATILVGAFAGVKVRDRLPKHHLTDETKNLVNVSTAVVATVSALVLGLLISNANTSFTRLGRQVTALSAEILRLDHILRRYGADAEPARNISYSMPSTRRVTCFRTIAPTCVSAILQPTNCCSGWRTCSSPWNPLIPALHGGGLRLCPLRPRSERPDGFSPSRLGRERRKRSSRSSSFGLHCCSPVSVF